MFEFLIGFIMALQIRHKGTTFFLIKQKMMHIYSKCNFYIAIFMIYLLIFRGIILAKRRIRLHICINKRIFAKKLLTKSHIVWKNTLFMILIELREKRW